MVGARQRGLGRGRSSVDPATLGKARIIRIRAVLAACRKQLADEAVAMPAQRAQTKD